MAHRNGAFYGAGGDAFAGHGKVHVDFGENFGVGLCPFGAQFDAAALHGVAAPLEDEHDVVSGATTGARQYQLHGPGRQVLATVFRLGSVWSAVHHDRVATSGLGQKTHA